MRAGCRHVQKRPPLREFVGVEWRGRKNSVMSLRAGAVHRGVRQQRAWEGEGCCLDCHCHRLRHLDRLRTSVSQLRLSVDLQMWGLRLKHRPGTHLREGGSKNALLSGKACTQVMRGFYIARFCRSVCLTRAAGLLTGVHGAQVPIHWVERSGRAAARYRYTGRYRHQGASPPSWRSRHHLHQRLHQRPG